MRCIENFKMKAFHRREVYIVADIFFQFFRKHFLLLLKITKTPGRMSSSWNVLNHIHPLCQTNNKTFSKLQMHCFHTIFNIQNFLIKCVQQHWILIFKTLSEAVLLTFQCFIIACLWFSTLPIPSIFFSISEILKSFEIILGISCPYS